MIQILHRIIGIKKNPPIPALAPSIICLGFLSLYMNDLNSNIHRSLRELQLLDELGNHSLKDMWETDNMILSVHDHVDKKLNRWFSFTSPAFSLFCNSWNLIILRCISQTTIDYPWLTNMNVGELWKISTKMSPSCFWDERVEDWQPSNVKIILNCKKNAYLARLGELH